jgi:phosphoribosyl-dephospho-CoA transferase
VRGATRAQRFAAWLSVADIAEQWSPEELWDGVANRPTRLPDTPESTQTEAVPAVAALSRVAPLLARLGYRWGPGGSVGFELATAVATATASSDLESSCVSPFDWSRTTHASCNAPWLKRRPQRGWTRSWKRRTVASRWPI